MEQVHKELQVLLVLKVLLVQQVLRVQLDLQDLQVTLVLRVLQDQLDLKDPQDLQVHKVQQERQVLRELLVLKEPLVHKDLQVTQVLKVLQDQMEQTVLKELLDLQDLLVPKVSFLSVGTNDLTQFLFAADRANPKLAARYDWLSPAILRFLKRIVDATAGHQVRLGLCGEMGGRRLEALALLGLGYRRLSITPVSVGPIKELIRQIDLDEVSSFMSRLIAQPPPDTRAAIAQWAQEHGIEVE